MSTSVTSAGGLPGPSALLPSYAPNTVSPCSPHARKLLTRLDKAELINLALSWLSSSSPAHLPPQLSRRPPRDREGARSKAKEEQWAAFDLSEERKARSLEDCITIWRKPMRDQRVPKIRAVDRILTVDWSEGLSFAMLAEVEVAFLKGRRTARTWIAAKLEYAPGRPQYSLLPAVALRDAYSQELRHYFAHYLHRATPAITYPPTPERSVSPPPADAKAPAPAAPQPDWTDAFTCFRLTLAPTSAELCASGFYILQIPRTPWLLISGSPGRGIENRTIALAAFAVAAGARSVNVSIPPSQFDKDAIGNDLQADGEGDGNSTRGKNIAELKGRDPLSLRDILARDVLPGGGKGLDMVTGYVEDGPLVDSLRRRREMEALNAYGNLLTPPPEEADLAKAQMQANDAQDTATTFVGNLSKRPSAREVERKGYKRRREAQDMFGSVPDEGLPIVPRIDFELHLPFPALEGYTRPSMRLLQAEPIRLRVEGSHVQAGLRKLVKAGLDERRDTEHVNVAGAGEDEDGEGEEAALRRRAQREKLFPSGLPSWMTQIKGTNVVVGMRSRDASATSTGAVSPARVTASRTSRGGGAGASDTLAEQEDTSAMAEGADETTEEAPQLGPLADEAEGES